MQMILLFSDHTREQADHIDCFRRASGTRAVDMLTYAVNTGRPVLVGIDERQCIVKPSTGTDDADRWNSLFDTALSFDEFERMQKAKVDSVEELPEKRYRINVIMPISFEAPHVIVELLAQSQGEIPGILEALLATPSSGFMAQIYSILGRDCLHLLFNAGKALVDPRGSTIIDHDPPPETPAFVIKSAFRDFEDEQDDDDS